MIRRVLFLYKHTYRTQVKNSPEREHQDAWPERSAQRLCSCSGRTWESVPTCPGAAGPAHQRSHPIRPGPGATPGHVLPRARRPHHRRPLHGRGANGHVLKERMTRAGEGQGRGHPLLRELLPCALPFCLSQGHNEFRASVAYNPGTPAVQPPERPLVSLLCRTAGQPAHGNGKAWLGGTRVPCVPDLAGEGGAGHRLWPWLFKVQEWTDARTRGGI